MKSTVGCGLSRGSRNRRHREEGELALGAARVRPVNDGSPAKQELRDSFRLAAQLLELLTFNDAAPVDSDSTISRGGVPPFRDGAETELVVETKTFHVRRPAVTGVGQAGGLNWGIVGATGAAALLAAGALLLLARRRHQLAVER